MRDFIPYDGELHEFGVVLLLEFARKFLGNSEEMVGKVVWELVKPLVVVARNEKRVSRSLGVNVRKGNHLPILICFGGWNLTAHNLAEYAVH